MDIAGKVALVTGGASGIGKAMIEILLQKQAKVVHLVDINETASKEVQKEFNEKYGDGKIRIHQCDVSSFEQMEACFKEVKAACGKLHIVCNNAGFFNERIWKRMLEVNLNGVIVSTKLAVEYMDGQPGGGGVIVNTSSVAGLTLVPFAHVYTTTKYAIIGFTRTVASLDPEVVKKNIRVNVFCPPAVDTPLYHGASEERYQESFDDLVKKHPPIQPAELVKHFVKLIEEPRHSETMFVTDADNFEIIPDQTKELREKMGVENIYAEMVKTAAK